MRHLHSVWVSRSILCTSHLIPPKHLFFQKCRIFCLVDKAKIELCLINACLLEINWLEEWEHHCHCPFQVRNDKCKQEPLNFAICQHTATSLTSSSHRTWSTLQHAHANYGTPLQSTGVFTQLASNIKGFAHKFACNSAYASCVNVP